MSFNYKNFKVVIKSTKTYSEFIGRLYAKNNNINLDKCLEIIGPLNKEMLHIKGHCFAILNNEIYWKSQNLIIDEELKNFCDKILKLYVFI